MAPHASSNVTQDHKTILIVEDHDIVRSIVRISLMDKGYQLLEAADGAEALQLSRRHGAPIDLLITDVRMPHMSGTELAGRLFDTHPETKVLYLSGEWPVPNQDVPADQFLPKPFTSENLLRKVRHLLAG